MQLEDIEVLSKQPLMSDPAVREHEPGAVHKEPEKEAPTPSPDDAKLDELATLSPLEYDRIRKNEAKKLGVRVGTLDKEIQSRSPHPEDGATSGSPLTLPEIEPWPESVDGQALIEEVVSLMRRYLSLPKHAADAIALWVVWSWLIDSFDVAPRLALLSPEKRCGKTTLLELLAALTNRALLASSITPAAIFRTIEAASPTLLIDEGDTFVTQNEALRGILNSGHTRASAQIVRCVGDEHEPRVFSTWCPMVLAAIGSLPNTVEDRSIIVPMQRKAPGEAVSPFPRGGTRARALRSELHTLAQKVRRWIEDHAGSLVESEPTVPKELHDRAADNWRPLFAIADEIGGAWPGKAREAATALSGGEVCDRESMKVQLLDDIRTLFEANSWDRIKSRDLCFHLADMEERPWRDWHGGTPITPNQLARALRPFEVTSRTLRFADDHRAKGYLKTDFTDIFSRYLPELTCSEGDSVTDRHQSEDEPLPQSVTTSSCHGSENAPNPAPDAHCHGVTDQNPILPDGEEVIDMRHWGGH